jgi:hypothetical protein
MKKWLKPGAMFRVDYDSGIDDRDVNPICVVAP